MRNVSDQKNQLAVEQEQVGASEAKACCIYADLSERFPGRGSTRQNDATTEVAETTGSETFMEN